MDSRVRPASEDGAVVKKAKLTSSTALVVINEAGDKHHQEAPARQATAPGRRSTLVGPSMALTGHGGEVFALDFHPRGDLIATAGRDRSIMLWEPTGVCPNTAVLHGSSNAILDLHFSADGEKIVSCGADKCGFVWDLESNSHIKRLRHDGIVNACDVRKQGVLEFVTASDDKTVKLWDLRSRECRHAIEYGVPVTAVCHASDIIYVGGIDGVIRGYDQRNLLEPSIVLPAHADVITCLTTTKDHGLLMSNGMDAVVRIFDVKPFAPQDRNILSLYGTQHGFEKNLLKCCWSPDATLVAAGSADRLVYVYRIRDGALLARLPGHQGSVNCVGFHPLYPEEAVIASGSSDKIVMLGEVDLPL